MTEDEPFLRTILANPDDRLTRLVYADWLDDRADPRAEYARLAARIAELPHGHADRFAVRRRMLELQPQLPAWWVAIVGGLRAADADNQDFAPAIEEVAHVRGRRTKRIDEKGYTLTVEAAATNPLTGAVAYLESCSKWRGESHDIQYHLNLRDATGHVVAWEPHTYNPYFGCDTKFLEWYGDAVVFIYREKHCTYVARFGFDGPAHYHAAEDHWVLDGREIAFIGYREAEVRRLSVPELEVLPSLSPEEAAARELMPAAPSWWLTG